MKRIILSPKEFKCTSLHSAECLCVLIKYSLLLPSCVVSVLPPFHVCDEVRGLSGPLPYETGSFLA